MTATNKSNQVYQRIQYLEAMHQKQVDALKQAKREKSMLQECNKQLTQQIQQLERTFTRSREKLEQENLQLREQNQELFRRKSEQPSRPTFMKLTRTLVAM